MSDNEDAPSRPWSAGETLLVIGFWTSLAALVVYGSDKDEAQADTACEVACEHAGADGERFNRRCLCSNGVRPFAW